jgi:ferritin-like metal-binding protein YciE
LRTQDTAGVDVGLGEDLLHQDYAAVLQASLKEEKSADQKLTAMAESKVNQLAA